MTHKRKDRRLIDLSIIIRKKRIAMGYNSAEKFAIDKGLNRSVYQRWENGEDLNISSLLRLLSLLGLSASELFREWEDMNDDMPQAQQNLSMVAEQKKGYRKGEL